MFIINKWYFVISCAIINLMSTKYILLTAETLNHMWSDKKEKWRLKNGS